MLKLYKPKKIKCLHLKNLIHYHIMNLVNFVKIMYIVPDL